MNLWQLAISSVESAPRPAKPRVQYDEQGRRLKRCKQCGPQLQPVDNFYRRGEEKWSALCKAHAQVYNLYCLRRYRARQKLLKRELP